MEQSTNNIHIVIFANAEEEKYHYYRKIIKSIVAMKNTVPHLSNITYKECKQGWGKNLEGYISAADIVLLLVSLAFVGSESYQDEVEIVLQKHRLGKVTVIPILLSPIPSEQSFFLDDLQPLPDDRRPITTWAHVDKAVVNVSQGLRNIIDQILKSRGYTEEQETDAIEQDKTPASSTAFNWTDHIPPSNYLNFSGKDQEEGPSRQARLRMIMRIFYEHQKAYYDLLSEQQVCEAVQQRSNSEYSLHDCQKDLKYLIDHFNLVRMDDIGSMAHSISAFESLLHKKFYRATSDGLEIEKLIEQRMQSNRGRLSKNDLRKIKEALLEIDEYLTKTELKPDDLNDVADQWDSIFERWESIITRSSDYFSELERSSQHGQYDFDKYMEYKNIVTNYVQSFADTLLDISHEIGELFSNWLPKKDLLIHSIARGKYRRHPDPEKGPSLEETVEQIRYQITSLETWFKEMAHVFYQRAASEIHRVVNRATSLALYQRSRVNNVTVLRKLASQFMDITNFESAQQLFDAAFAHVLPLHLSESLAGHAQMYERAEGTLSVWDEPAPAQLFLAPAKQKNTSAGVRSKSDDPMYEDIQKSYTLQKEQIQKEADRQQRFDCLFAQHILNLGSRVSIDPGDRDILEEIIDACLNHPAKRYQDQTGNIILLLNPYEQMYVHLCSHDGVLFLPCYQLKRQNSPEDGD